jgi:hypothetical protein
LLLPHGDAKVLDRLELDGRFVLEHAQFSDPAIREKLADLSRRAQGKKPDEPIGRIASNMRGQFKLKGGTIRFAPVAFDLPGAEVVLTGVYGLRSEALDFAEAAGGGIKGFFLKAVDPIFRKHGKGAVIPITIRGPREQPKFGVVWGKVFK